MDLRLRSKKAYELAPPWSRWRWPWRLSARRCGQVNGGIQRPTTQQTARYRSVPKRGKGC